MPISIHALVKRATFKRSDDVKSFTISIHALVKRATVAINPDTAGDFDFNPRPREKGDSRKWLDVVATAYFNPRPREKGDKLLPFSVGKIGISIHALVKRATPMKKF